MTLDFERKTLVIQVTNKQMLTSGTYDVAAGGGEYLVLVLGSGADMPSISVPVSGPLERKLSGTRTENG